MATIIEPSITHADPAVLRAALAKVATTDAPKASKIAIAFSGGLDSTLCIVLAKEKYGAEIVPITVDVGQGEDEVAMSFATAQQLGITLILIDAKQEFTQHWLAKAIQANAGDNGFPVSTSMTRQLIAQKVAQVAVEQGCDALVEGSIDGHDQSCSHNIFALFAPDLHVLVPVSGFGLTSAEKLALCAHWGVPITGTMSNDDGTTPAQAPETPQTVTLTFENGIPVALDGEMMPLDKLILSLNAIGGVHGISKIDMWEDGIMDLKSREIPEAPGATIILAVHKDIEGMTLTKQQVIFKKQVDATWASLVYHGEWSQPLKADLDAFIANTQAVVQGTWTVALSWGNIDIIKRELVDPLFKPEIHSIASTGFNQQLCGPAAYIKGLPDQALASLDTTMRTNETIAEELVAD